MIHDGIFFQTCVSVALIRHKALNLSSSLTTCLSDIHINPYVYSFSYGAAFLFVG